MPSFASPHPRYQRSFLTSVQEILDAGEDERWTAARPFARDLGIDPALLTCDDTNVASRRVIESNGGVFEDQREDKLRFWVPTSD
jgi:Predicted acetyltransferase